MGLQRNFLIFFLSHRFCSLEFLPSYQNTITVVSGDNLSHIASRYLDDASRWREIYNLNRNTIDDPDVIRPGMVLRMPNM